jgi:hypothetical protein
MDGNVDLQDLLHRLGIDRRNLKALLLLPLVEVAWADGRVQPAEHALIDRKAHQYSLREEDRLVLANWLHHAPTESYLRTGCAALAWLAKVGDPLLDPAPLRTLLDDAREVAAAAGGFFGWGAISANERRVLARLAADLESPPLTPDTPAHPDFVRKNAIVTLSYSPPGEPEGAGVLVPLFDAPRRLALSEAGLLIGSEADVPVRIVGDAQIARYHARVSEKTSGIYAQSLGGPVWVNGERIVERRLLGGETIRLTDAACFVFKLVRPLT